MPCARIFAGTDAFPKFECKLADSFIREFLIINYPLCSRKVLGQELQDTEYLKDIMQKLGIPDARFVEVNKVNNRLQYYFVLPALISEFDDAVKRLSKLGAYLEAPKDLLDGDTDPL